jgi:hypothetical protein
MCEEPCEDTAGQALAVHGCGNRRRNRRLTSRPPLFTPDAEFRGNYSGTLNATGGTLTGTQVWTRASGGGGVTRACTGALLEIKCPVITWSRRAGLIRFRTPAAATARELHKTFSGQIGLIMMSQAADTRRSSCVRPVLGGWCGAFFCAHPVRGKGRGAEYETYAYVDRSIDFRLGLA